jgi:hypothetical protein
LDDRDLVSKAGGGGVVGHSTASVAVHRNGSDEPKGAMQIKPSLTLVNSFLKSDANLHTASPEPSMLKFIEGDRLVDEFKNLMKGSASAELAVAFWGEGSATQLQIERNSSARIICNLGSGACNPKEIRR